MANVLNRITKEYRENRHTPNYMVGHPDAFPDAADWICNPDLSSVSGVHKKYWKVAGDVISEMTPAEKTVVDDSAAELNPLKVKRYLEIDIKTQTLIAAGFVHDSGTFSLSLPAQHNWHGLLTGADKQWITFPLKISTIDNNEYTLQNSQALGDFVEAGFNAVLGHLESGRSLKKQVYDATTKAAVDAVVDTR